MSHFGSYFGLGPTRRVDVDTSQGLLGFGASDPDVATDMITIYEGVGAAPAPAARGCGCTARRGRLAGFGTEILPPEPPTDSPPMPGVTAGTNLQTALVALLVAGSAVAIGVALFGSKPAPMRANAPRFLFGKKGKTTRRQARASGTVLSAYRWGRETPGGARWAGKHLAHSRYRTNGSQKYVVLWGHTAGTTLPSTATLTSVQRLCKKKGLRARLAVQRGDGKLSYVGNVTPDGTFHGASHGSV